MQKSLKHGQTTIKHLKTASLLQKTAYFRIKFAKNHLCFSIKLVLNILFVYPMILIEDSPYINV